MFEQRTLPIPELAALKHGHIACRELRPFLLPEMWNRYRRFAFVRDPFERFESLCRFWQVGTAAERRRLLAEPSIRDHPLVRPQSYFLCGDSGDLMVDEVGRYEDLPGEFRRICSKFDIPAGELPWLNASADAPRPETRDPAMRDPELRELVREFYRDDFRLAAPCDAARSRLNNVERAVSC
jgi:hypothetical protein